jgi:glycosyltransferase involved in cell wall biosynthesis
MALISVIIPAYNRAHLLGETLRSILNQTVTADEVIMVDDGSTDDTAKAAETAFAEWESRKVKGQRSPEFKVIRQENSGPAAARNAGFTVSKGEFIHFFDSDDLAAPNKHEIQLKVLQESGADIAYGPWVKGQIGDGKFIPENQVLQQRGLPSDNNAELIKQLLTRWSIVPHACIFRRSIVEKAGGFPEHLFGTEDQMMFLNCLLSGARVVHSPGTLELYRTDDPSKLTAVGKGQRRHVLNWARFLIDADQACQKSGITARHWFGFRARAWQTIQDLEGFSIHNENLKLGLEEITGVWMPRVLYRTHRAIERKWLGLKMRTAGHRTLSPFRSGPITKDQNDLIERLLFNQKNASVHSFDSP